MRSFPHPPTMVDLGISKLLLIATVALVVIGPHKLPHVARVAGTLLGRARRYLAAVQAEVERSMYIEELRSVQTTVASTIEVLHDLPELSEPLPRKPVAQPRKPTASARRIPRAFPLRARLRSDAALAVRNRQSGNKNE